MKCQELISLLESHGYGYISHRFNDHIKRVGPSYGSYPGLYLLDVDEHCVSWITLETCEDYQEFIAEVHQPHPARYSFTGNDGNRYTCRLIERLRASTTLCEVKLYDDDGYLFEEVYRDQDITAPIFRVAKHATKNSGNKPLVTMYATSDDFFGPVDGPAYLMYREVTTNDGTVSRIPCCVTGYNDHLSHKSRDDYEAHYPILKFWTREHEAEYNTKATAAECKV